MKQEARYIRQLALPEIGEKGQELLSAAKVLIIGAGGLGSPVALYLAAAGVGTLGILDYDCVNASNFNRQILYEEADEGKRKADAAAENAASQFLDGIGIDYLVWPQSQTKPDGETNRAVLNESKIRILKIEQVEVDGKNKLITGSGKEVIL